MEQMAQFDLRAILVVIGVLTIVTGVVTEVLKHIFWRIVPSPLLAIAVAETLALGAGLTYALFAGTTILWHHVLAAIVAAYGVACSAMFSYDKIKEIKAQFISLKNNRGQQ